MAFKLALKDTYKVKVKVQTPSDNGFETSEFTAEFKRVGMNDIKELQDLPQRDVLEKVVVGYSDLLDGDNKPVDFNSLNLGLLLDIPQAQQALAESFWSSLFKAKEKN